MYSRGKYKSGVASIDLLIGNNFDVGALLAALAPFIEPTRARQTALLQFRDFSTAPIFFKRKSPGFFPGLLIMITLYF